MYISLSTNHQPLQATIQDSFLYSSTPSTPQTPYTSTRTQQDTASTEHSFPSRNSSSDQKKNKTSKSPHLHPFSYTHFFYHTHHSQPTPRQLSHQRTPRQRQERTRPSQPHHTLLATPTRHIPQPQPAAPSCAHYSRASPTPTLSTAQS